MDFTNLTSAVYSVNVFINSLIPLIVGIAVVLFLIGVLGYITAGGDEERREAARNMIIFGIIALFVMVAVWGFVKILTRTFFSNTDPSAAPYVPVTPGYSGPPRSSR